MPFQTTTTAAPAPVVGRARAALLVLEHAERTGLPMPFDVTVHDHNPAVSMLFRSVADLAQWALWIETQVVEHRAADGTIHHIATGHALDQAVRLVRVESSGAGR